MQGDLEKRLWNVDGGHISVYELEKVRPLCGEAADTLAAVRETWDAIYDLGSTFAGGRHYDKWVRLSQEMQRLVDRYRSDTDE